MHKGLMAALLAGALSISAAGAADAAPKFYNGYKPPMDSAGHPDLNGVWTNATITPFERPASYGDRLVMTPQEVAAAEGKVAASNKLAAAPTAADATVKDLPADCSAGRGKNCNYNTGWTDPGSTIMRVAGVPHTSILTTPDGRIPVTLDGRRPTRIIEGEEAGRGTAQPGYARADPPGRNDNPEGRSLGERCIYMGSPVPRSGLYNNNYMIQQGDDSVAIWTEMIHEVRIARIGGKHRSDGIRPWNGDSIAWYEGPTLVIETTNYNPKQNFYGASDQLKVTERFTRVSPTKLYYEFKVEDPKTWAKPWGGEYEFTSSPGIYEYACHEGNYGLEDILAGARHDEGAVRTATAER
jgi:hypothetical protein